MPRLLRRRASPAASYKIEQETPCDCEVGHAASAWGFPSRVRAGVFLSRCAFVPRDNAGISAAAALKSHVCRSTRKEWI